MWRFDSSRESQAANGGKETRLLYLEARCGYRGRPGRSDGGVAQPGQSTGPSIRASRVQIPSSPPSLHSSGAEHQDDNLERHVRLVLQVPSAHRLTDKGTGLRSRRWGFDSLWARAFQGWLAQRQSAASTPRITGFNSLASYGG